MGLELELALATTREAGWATARGDLGDVMREAIGLQMAQLMSSRGKSISTLRPYTEREAPPRSLSAVYGLGEQPLHTDGAHLPEPPDIIVLHCATTSRTPTVVWAPKWFEWRRPSALYYGVFTVRGNGGSWLATALEESRLRFDPVSMSPADAQARQVVAFFHAARSDEHVHVHEWLEPNTLLFIDNRRALHARNAIDPSDSDRKVERLALRRESP